MDNKNTRNNMSEQLPLPLRPASGTEKKSGNGSSFNDPAFSENKTLPVHRWVPWIAGFSCRFVDSALERHLGEKKGIVLDPFCGVGTTLVEAAIRGHKAVGFEINPYAAFASKVKISAISISPRDLGEQINEFDSYYKAKVVSGYSPHSSPPSGFKTRTEFYSPAVLRKVLIFQDYLAEIGDKKIRDIFRIAFASTMVKYSNYSYEPSLGRRKSSGKEDILDYEVGGILIDKLTEIKKDIEWLQQNTPHYGVDTQVYNDSFFECEKYIASESVDLIVTSPPYLNNYHYNRNTRPQLYWLGLVNSPTDMKPFEQGNFGKFWQTVREEGRVDLLEEIRIPEIENQLELLRGLNSERGIYGGNGWANYAASYFNDCYYFSKGIIHSLTQGGSALVVIGNSILQGIQIPTDRFFGMIAQSTGLDLVEIHIPRETRVGNSIIQSDVRMGTVAKASRLYEAVVELRKS